MAWKRSHTRANRYEDNESRNWRRGNAAADEFANMGRELHHPIFDIVSNVKYLADNVTKWIRWIGRAASLQYSSELEGCDHHLPERERAAKGRTMIKVHLPAESTVLRRIPWASRSMGTIEYTDDLRMQQEAGQQEQRHQQVADTQFNAGTIDITSIQHPTGGASQTIVPVV